ncbi:MAG: SDR family oxidoreductase [Caldilineaceae bacterium]
MTRVLILGAAGMLGHKLCQVYRDRFDTWATVRERSERYVQYDLLPSERFISNVDAFKFDTIVQAFAIAQPQVVINCIGIIKQLSTAKDPVISLTINSLLPHRLAQLCSVAGARLIHISTDCVFSGRKGKYTEADISDAEDLYGRTKYLGEVSVEQHLTLRTSIVGRELQTTTGLVEWFLSNRGGRVRGYTEAIYTGFTTLALAEIMAEIIEHKSHLAGLYQVSSDPINKFDLLCLLREQFAIPIEIEPFVDFKLDRSLSSQRFRTESGIAIPSWFDMVEAMAQDKTPYEIWRMKR